MRLQGKHLLMIVADGISGTEAELFHGLLESEYAQLTIAAPDEYLSIDHTTFEGSQNPISVDLSLEDINPELFDALILPSGELYADLLCLDDTVITLVQYFHQRGLPLFASGSAIKILHAAGVMETNIFLREGGSSQSFVQEMVHCLIDGEPLHYGGAPNLEE